MTTEDQTTPPDKTPTLEEVAEHEATLAEEAKVQEAIAEVAKEAKLRSFLSQAVITALSNSQITSQTGGTIGIEDPEIQSMFQSTIFADAQYRKDHGDYYTMPNPNLKAHQELLNKILDEYGWQGRVTSYDKSTDCERSRTVFTLCMTPLKR